MKTQEFAPTAMTCDTGEYDPCDADGPDSARDTVIEGAHSEADGVAIHHVIQTVQHREVANGSQHPAKRNNKL